MKCKFKAKEQQKLIKDNKSPKSKSSHKSKLQRDQTDSKKHRVPETPLMLTYLCPFAKLQTQKEITEESIKKKR